MLIRGKRALYCYHRKRRRVLQWPTRPEAPKKGCPSCTGSCSTAATTLVAELKEWFLVPFIEKCKVVKARGLADSGRLGIENCLSFLHALDGLQVCNEYEIVSV